MTDIKDIKYTCPEIDSAKATVEDVQKEVGKALKWVDETEMVRDQLEYIEMELYYLPDTLENLRISNSALREAANDLQEEVDSLKSENEALRDQVNELDEAVGGCFR